MLKASINQSVADDAGMRFFFLGMYLAELLWECQESKSRLPIGLSNVLVLPTFPAASGTRPKLFPSKSQFSACFLILLRASFKSALVLDLLEELSIFAKTAFGSLSLLFRVTSGKGSEASSGQECSIKVTDGHFCPVVTAWYVPSFCR